MACLMKKLLVGARVASLMLLLNLVVFFPLEAGTPPPPEESYPFQHGFSIWKELSYNKNFSHFYYANANAPKGGTLTLSELGTFDSFNPFLIQGIAPASVGLIYNSLMMASDDDDIAQYGLIADGIYVNPGKKIIAFHINPRATFQDNKPITAEDVAWTFQTLLDSGNPAFRSYYRDVAGVRTAGKSVVVFDINNPDNHDLPAVLGGIPVLPKHFWQGKDFNKPSMEVPLGSGPYRVKDFAAGKFITYELVPNYWGRNLNTQRGKNNFATIKYKFYRDNLIEFEAFKAGQVDLRVEPSARMWATGYNDIPAIKNGKMIKREFYHKRIAPTQAIQFNLRRPLFAGEDGRTLRRALQLLWDFEWANDNLMYHAYVRTSSMFDNSPLRARGMPSAAEVALLKPFRQELPKEVFGPAYLPPQSNKDGNRANMLAAVKLLEDNGYYYKGQKLYSPKKIPVEFTIFLQDAIFIPVLTPFAQSVKRVGGKVNLRILDSSVLTRRLLNFDYDVIISRYNNSISPGSEQRLIWGSQAAKQMGSGNIAGAQSPALDFLIERLNKAQTYSELVTIAHAMDRVIMWQYYFIPMYYLNYDRIVYWNKIICPNKISDQGFNLTTCWSTSAK